MKRKKIVVALGHKALGTTLPEQKAAVKRSAKVIADLVAAGADVVITHSNAPQVGMIHMAMNEFGKMHTDYSAAPMSVCSAMSEATSATTCRTPSVLSFSAEESSKPHPRFLHRLK